MDRLRICSLLVGVMLGTAGLGRAQSDYSLRFHGNGVNDIDRVKIRIDDPATIQPGPPVDVGAGDFTIEFWMKARDTENTAAAINCGFNNDWILGNIILDRDRFNQSRAFGLSIAGGRMSFGVLADNFASRTICSQSSVLDDRWHHIAVQRRRSDGRMWLYVDGSKEVEVDGPDGDLSYPDDGVPGPHCGGPCVNSDPFIVLGAEKHDAGPAYPSYSGWMDELRFSDVLRYSASFVPPTAPFQVDANTVALYPMNEGSGNVVGDVAQHPGGSVDGERKFGGTPAGPQWSTETPFQSLLLTQGALVRGQTTTLQLSGAMSGERAWFLYTRAGLGSGPCPRKIGFLCLDLLKPIVVLGNATANAGGTASFQWSIPSGIATGPLQTQAIVRRGTGFVDSVKSNAIDDTVLP